MCTALTQSYTSQGVISLTHVTSGGGGGHGMELSHNDIGDHKSGCITCPVRIYTCILCPVKIYTLGLGSVNTRVGSGINIDVTLRKDMCVEDRGIDAHWSIL